LNEVLDYIAVRPKIAISKETIIQFVNEACVMADINKKLTAQSCRITFAFRSKKNGFTLNEIEKLIGNSRVVTII